jgi:hypothetical protein
MLLFLDLHLHEKSGVILTPIFVQTYRKIFLEPANASLLYFIIPAVSSTPGQPYYVKDMLI